MTSKTKTLLATFLFNGILFAILMAIFDFISDDPFNIYAFLFRMIFFGLGMTIFKFFGLKKIDKQK